MAQFQKIAVMGAGLIGGSVARAAAARGIAEEIAVYDAAKETRSAVMEAGLKNVSVVPEIIPATEGADLILLCVPPGQMEATVRALLPALSAQAIVSDVGSVKGAVETAMAPLLRGKARWIGGHPMAGREKGGFANSDAALFEGSAVILTPTAGTDSEALAKLEEFWGALGARVRRMAAADHDREMARLSHAVHLAAMAVMKMAGEADLSNAGPGLRDTTRIAAGAAALWKEILLANREEIIPVLDRLIADLAVVRRLLAEGKETELHDWILHANQLRGLLENPRVK